MKVHLNSRDISFIKKFKSDAVWINSNRDKCVYIVSLRSGARILTIESPVALEETNISIPQNLLDQFIPGFYQISIESEYVLVSIYSSDQGDFPIVSYRIYNAISGHEVSEYISLSKRDDFSKSNLPTNLLKVYSIVVSTNKAIYHTIEFGAGLAYFNSPNIVVYTNTNERNEFSINKDNMWFLSFSDNISTLITRQYVCMKSKEGMRDYTVVFYKLRTGQPPKIAKLENRESLSVQSVNLNLFSTLLSGLKEDRHNPPKINFLSKGFAIIHTQNIGTVVPLDDPPKINFSLDALAFRSIASKLGGVASLSVYNDNFLLRQKDIHVIGRCEINV